MGNSGSTAHWRVCHKNLLHFSGFHIRTAEVKFALIVIFHPSSSSKVHYPLLLFLPNFFLRWLWKCLKWEQWHWYLVRLENIFWFVVLLNEDLDRLLFFLSTVWNTFTYVLGHVMILWRIKYWWIGLKSSLVVSGKESGEVEYFCLLR